MSRTQISIKLEDGLLERIDQLAESVGVTRTAVIEKALKDDLPQQEAFHRSLENPVIRAIHAKLTSPTMLRLIGRLANDEFSDAEIEALAVRGPQQRAGAESRAAARKARTRPGEAT